MHNVPLPPHDTAQIIIIMMMLATLYDINHIVYAVSQEASLGSAGRSVTHVIIGGAGW
jgi:hypothetical protein